MFVSCMSCQVSCLRAKVAEGRGRVEIGRLFVQMVDLCVGTLQLLAKCSVIANVQKPSHGVWTDCA